MSSSSSSKPLILTNQQAVAGPPTAPRGWDPATHQGPYDDASGAGSTVEGGNRDKERQRINLIRARAFRSICILSNTALDFNFSSTSFVYTNFKIEISIEVRGKVKSKHRVEMLIMMSCSRHTSTPNRIDDPVPSYWNLDCLQTVGGLAALLCLLFLVPNLSTPLPLRFYLLPSQTLFPHRHTLTHTLQ